MISFLKKKEIIPFCLYNKQKGIMIIKIGLDDNTSADLLGAGHHIPGRIYFRFTIRRSQNIINDHPT